MTLIQKTENKKREKLHIKKNLYEILIEYSPVHRFI